MTTKIYKISFSDGTFILAREEHVEYICYLRGFAKEDVEYIGNLFEMEKLQVNPKILPITDGLDWRLK